MRSTSRQETTSHEVRRIVAFALIASLLSACAGSAPSAETRGVSFTSAAVSLEVAAVEAPVAVRGVVTGFSIDPIDDSDFVAGRRMMQLTVAEVFRGDIAVSDKLTVWYGSELGKGVQSEHSPNIVEPPARGSDVLLLASPAVLGTVDQVYIPIDGTGISTVLDGRVIAHPSTRALGNPNIALETLEPVLSRPAPNPDLSNDGPDYGLPDPETLPREPQPDGDVSVSDSDRAFKAMLEKLEITEAEFMQLPGDEQQRLADEHGL